MEQAQPCHVEEVMTELWVPWGVRQRQKEPPWGKVLISEASSLGAISRAEP